MRSKFILIYYTNGGVMIRPRITVEPSEVFEGWLIVEF